MANETERPVTRRLSSDEERLQHALSEIERLRAELRLEHALCEIERVSIALQIVLKIEGVEYRTS